MKILINGLNNLKRSNMETLEEAKQRAANYMSLKGALEPKQETLEEFIESYVNRIDRSEDGLVEQCLTDGAKWQQETMYSEEEVLVILDKFLTAMIKGEKTGLLEKWFEQFKKK